MVLGMAIVLGMLGMLAACLLAAVIVLTVAVRRRSHNDRQRHERVAREVDRIAALASSGRISAEEAAELRQALEDQRPPSDTPPARGRLQKTKAVVLAGVCGGLAEWMGWDPTLVRLGYALATLLIAGFPGIIVYIILAIVMPAPPDAPSSGGKAVLTAVLAVVLASALLLVMLSAGYVLARRVTHTWHGMPTIVRLH